MKNKFIALLSAIAIPAILVFNSGCRENSIIKANVIPSNDFIYSNTIGDTLTINCKTVYDDSVATGYTLSAIDVIHGLGALSDPYFGHTNWGIFTQLVPNTNNLDLSATPPDSAVLILPYAGFTWGDTSSTSDESFSVYRMTQSMTRDDDTVYYSNTAFAIDATPVGTSPNINLRSLRKDSIKVAGNNRAPHLRIKLTTAFMNDLVAAAKASANSASFLSIIKGIYIRPTDTNSTSVTAVPYFRMTGESDYSRAAIALYYNKAGLNDPDSVQTVFINFTRSDCAHNNYITRRYSNPVVEANKYFTSTQLSDSIVLMQNEPGAAIDIHIPHLKNLPLGIINKAQLVITQLPGNNSDMFGAPSRLYPVGVNEYGASYTIADRYPTDNIATLDFIDGTQRIVTLPDGNTVSQYYINIPREVQKAIVNRADDLHLRINGTATYPGAYRLIAGGKNSNKYYKIRLNIVYSNIN
ncbi:MAG: DUF4270 family protein [Bacteroidetes bacterium]|nr:DUF4270 family protein [Bacteroidota bacterium]